MAELKIKTIEGLKVDLSSTNPMDFVSALNKIADNLGGVSNMGIFADIVSITPIEEMRVGVVDGFIDVKTGMKEKPGRELTIKDGINDPYELDYDVLLGK